MPASPEPESPRTSLRDQREAAGSVVRRRVRVVWLCAIWPRAVPSGVEFGDEWKVTGVVTSFATRFAEHGLEVFF